MKTNNIVKILVTIVIILSIGLIATIIKLTTMSKSIVNQDTPTVVDKSSGDLVEKPEENVIEKKLEENQQKPVEQKPLEEIEDNSKGKDPANNPPKEEKPFKEEKPNNEKSNSKDKPNKDKPPKEEKKHKDNKDQSKEDKAIVKPKYISKDEAVKIGLNKVGDGAKLIKIESDLDDNPPKYELEIILGDYEYEIEIHAITGAVIDFEKEEIDD